VIAKSTAFQRLLLPGFAFKAVVIGGGYATGRELTTFFVPSGPRGRPLRHVVGNADLERGLHCYFSIRPANK
jgi:hypothetical protein